MGKKSKSIIQQGFYIYSANPNYEKIGIVGKLRRVDCSTMNQSTEIEVKNLDHLGLVAGIIDEIGIVEIINEQVSMGSRRNCHSWASSKSDYS